MQVNKWTRLEYDLMNDAAGNPATFVQSLLSIFVLLKLMSVGHVRVKPFFDDICDPGFPQDYLDVSYPPVLSQAHKKRFAFGLGLSR